MAETAQEQIQPLGVTKRMLGMAEKEPLACAFALTKDKKECVLLIAKSGSGKKAASTLKADGKAFIDPQTLRFGRVAIDAPNDPGTVNFTVNRAEAGGTIIHMNKLVKRSGYQALVINADENLESEGEAGADATPPEAPPPPPTEPVIDADALKKRLTALVQRMMTIIAADPARKDTLLRLAKTAQTQLGTNNLKTATESVDELEASLNQPSASANDPTKGAVTYAKTRLAWIATSKKVADDVGKLRTALESRYGKHENGADIVSVYDKQVAPILTAFNEDLADKLDEVINATDPQTRQALIEEARQMIVEHTKFLESHALIADLDDNPFVKLSIRSTMATTLKALAAAVR